MKRLIVISLCFSLLSCTQVGKYVNPYHKDPSEVALLGDANDHALNPEKQTTEKARTALESLRQYDEALMPQPYKPVYRPAVIRLMWIPDHLNRFGDLIPSHYYYLKVREGRFNVTDAFELQDQLEGNSKGSSSNFPYIKAK